MSDEIGTYTFLPYLRQGLANKVVAPADPNVKRGQITVTMTITGTGLTEPPSESFDKTIELYSPGDVIGIDPKAIIKVEPRNAITNFEPNYLPYIEFYDEDFPWRYTPCAAASGRLTPWLALLVLAEGEFEDGKNILRRPLNYITLSAATNMNTVFPPAQEMWAWAHVHANKNMVGTGDDPVSTNEAAVIGQFKSLLIENADLAYSRILSPRKLGENTAYHAFLIPTFESGRLAGLGYNPIGIAGFQANSIAWVNYGGRLDGKDFPYYYRWYFRTGRTGDFEYLVRLLQPRVPDSRIGRRDIDVQDPSQNIHGIDDARLHGILRLGGALQVPVACYNEQEAADYQNYEQWYDSYPHRFQRELAAFVNLADDYAHKTTADAHNDSPLSIEDENPNDPDPMVTAPLYGSWHSLTSRLLTNADGTSAANSENWVHNLNLDPRWRTAANFGTEVIQEKQEEYMDAAWSQLGDVLEANRRLRWAKLACLASKVWYKNNIQPKASVAVERYLALTASMQKRIVTGGKTVFHHISTSRIPQALLSAPMRRILRPRGRMMKRLKLVTATGGDNLIHRVNLGEVTPARPRAVPDELLTHADVAMAAKPANVPGLLVQLLTKYPWLQYVPLLAGFALIIILLLLLAFGIVGVSILMVIAVIAIIAVPLYLFLNKLNRTVRNAESILPENQTPEAVTQYPKSPNFRVTEFGDSFVPATGATDSVEAARFKGALRDTFDFVQRSAKAGKPPVYTELDIPLMVNAVVAGINPVVTISRYVKGFVSLPLRIVSALQEDFVEAMAYPEIDVPMYKPLLDLSNDNFCPNINLIEQNSITLLETNQPFIESYMVGLNHEFARELLWREYPTDQRGSYFRQFWDVSSYLNKEGLDAEALREKLRDIPPLHRWPRRSVLGDHDHREEAGEKENEVVLVIRGELLKKYPTAVIYAHRAKWVTDEHGNRILTQPRDFDDSEPPEVVCKNPLYEAKVEPDIYFFGFDLTVFEAKGDSGENPEDKAGWFFVIKERPGEPRFGLDVPGQAGDLAVTQLNSWNELAWSHIMADASPGKFITIAGTRTITVRDPGTPGNDVEQQQKEDSHMIWRDSIDAAELAYILYQVPVLVGVHATEMLPDKC